ncbi:2471_t:CDS:1 [Ambispora gerdemannii]|uniref:2471_t:CDS:1 n=1 Tax=Ambispora gerdemannii TaxID=144530 RepID=A0A9N8VDS4_9GLOM|nr:2471_t:CDS:1 [Ambispora gerdemannii]
MKENVNSTVKKSTSSLNITIPFPPQITFYNLIEKAITKLNISGKTSRVPNEFIAYRMCFYKALQASNHPSITQPQLSAIAKEFWLKEPEYVRTEYKKIALEARNYYKRLAIEQKLKAHEQKDKLKVAQDSSSSIISLSSKSSNSPEIDNLSSSHSTPKPGNELTINEIDFSSFSNRNTTSLYSNYFDVSTLPQTLPIIDFNTQTNIQLAGILPSQFEYNNTPYPIIDESSINLVSTSFLSNQCEGCRNQIELLTRRVEELENKLTKLAKSVEN